MRIYLARQPVYDLDNQVWGYELLYRSNRVNRFDGVMDGCQATKELVKNAVAEFGLRALTDGKVAFINCTKEFLMSDFVLLVSPKEFVLEILETVEFDPPLLERLALLKKKKYTLALDDYTGTGIPLDVLEYIEIIKVDFKLTDRTTRRQIAQQYSSRKRVLAEKIETETELRHAKEDGYTLFQGYYFSQPLLVEKSTAEVARATDLRAWRELRKPAFSYDTLAAIIRSDVNLSYKFLIKINTMQYYRSRRVHSIKAALVRMGGNEVRHWMLLVLLQSVTGRDGEDTIKVALARGIFAETMARCTGNRRLAEEAYSVGLFSMIDIIIGEELHRILDVLGLPRVVEEALLHQTGVLAELLEFTKKYENGDWKATDAFLVQFHLDPEWVSTRYVEAVAASDLAFRDVRFRPDVFVQ